MQSKLETKFINLWNTLYPEIYLQPQFVFASPRRFRADFAHPDAMVLIELQGGIFTKGASHSSTSGIKRDCEKQFLAAANGYLVFTLHTDMITVSNLAVIAKAIKARTQIKLAA